MPPWSLSACSRVGMSCRDGRRGRAALEVRETPVGCLVTQEQPDAVAIRPTTLLAPKQELVVQQVQDGARVRFVHLLLVGYLADPFDREEEVTLRVVGGADGLGQSCEEPVASIHWYRN